MTDPERLPSGPEEAPLGVEYIVPGSEVRPVLVAHWVGSQWTYRAVDKAEGNRQPEAWIAFAAPLVGPDDGLDCQSGRIELAGAGITAIRVSSP